MGEIRTPCCAIETLVLAQSLVFTIGYVAKGEDLYEASHSFFSEIISWEFLIPIVAIQVTLLLMNLVSFLAIRCTIPYFLLPYIAISVFSLFIATALVGITIDRIVWVVGWSWPSALLLLFLFLYIIIELYFISLKLTVFKILVKRKKAVQVRLDSDLNHVFMGTEQRGSCHVSCSKSLIISHQRCNNLGSGL
ncbi:hypothetical protein Q1695_001128 [Nippostrongylus brasiliensis]|nr:hypothetical protein Q1695_001128 [Nippostrongylus brasiliensis]